LPRGDEDAYERASWEAIEECKQLNPPYNPTDWIGMVRRWGAAEAARRLLVNGDIQYGFRRLVQSGRPELTVEWSALLPRWQRIFPQPHRAEVIGGAADARAGHCRRRGPGRSPACAATPTVFSPSVTEQRVWHLELQRHGRSGESGHEAWHVLGKVVGACVRLSAEAGAGTVARPTERSDAKLDARMPNSVLSHTEMSDRTSHGQLL
jgi:hypothetical protein